MYKLLVIFVFLFQGSGKFAYSQRQPAKEPLAVINRISAREIEIVDDAFINRVDEKELTFLKLKERYSPDNIKRTALVGAPSHAEKSIILSFTSGRDSLKFINNTSSIYPIFLSLYTSKVTLDSQLRIGVSKDYFMRKYKIKNVPDKIRISDTEGGCVFQFLFRINRLYNIRYTVFLD